MKMKNEKAKQRRAQVLAGETREHTGGQNCAESAVQIPMVIFCVVEKSFRVVQSIVDDVHNHSETIRVRQDARECHQPAIARVVCRFGRDDPTGEKVGYGRHLWFVAVAEAF